jgi:hypothetical protein
MSLAGAPSAQRSWVNRQNLRQIAFAKAKLTF